MPTGDPVLTGIKAIDTVTGEGILIALNSKTAQPLWTMQTGGPIASSPMSYAIDGKQFIAISASGALSSYGLPK